MEEIVLFELLAEPTEICFVSSSLIRFIEEDLPTILQVELQGSFVARPAPKFDPLKLLFLGESVDLPQQNSSKSLPSPLLVYGHPLQPSLTLFLYPLSKFKVTHSK